jgi:hypothetical protein
VPSFSQASRKSSRSILVVPVLKLFPRAHGERRNTSKNLPEDLVSTLLQCRRHLCGFLLSWVAKAADLQFSSALPAFADIVSSFALTEQCRPRFSVCHLLLQMRLREARV